MHLHLWNLIGIVLAVALLCWANFKLVRGYAQTVIYVLLILFGGFLVLASLGILPNMGVSVGP